jgi:hypothetical protein
MYKFTNVKLFKLVVNKKNKNSQYNLKPELLIAIGSFRNSFEFATLKLIYHLLSKLFKFNKPLKVSEFKIICLNLLSNYSENRSTQLYIQSTNSIKNLGYKQYSYNDFNIDMVKSVLTVIENKDPSKTLDSEKLLDLLTSCKKIWLLKRRFTSLKIEHVKKSYSDYDNNVNLFIDLIKEHDKLMDIVKKMFPKDFNTTIKFIKKNFLEGYSDYRKNI